MQKLKDDYYELMKSIVFDIEADSLEPTKIWCIAAVDADSGETKTYNPSQIIEGLAYLSTADKLIVIILLVTTYQL